MLRLAALPMSLSWTVPPASCRTDEEAALTVAAPGNTDMFCDPAGGDPPVLTAPRALGVPPAGDYQLSARVRVGFADTYDAGVLLLWADELNWAKLCFERSPQGQPMAVSVVTRAGTGSDDANGFVVAGDTMWLRISRLGAAFAFHGSTDGSRWQFVRYFALGEESAGASVGFEAQSPVGEGCTVDFDHVVFVPQRLSSLRAGV